MLPPSPMPTPATLGLLTVSQDVPAPAFMAGGDVRLRRMPDGAYSLQGLPKGGSIHLKEEMRDWQRVDGEGDSVTYETRSVRAAYQYAQDHGLTVRCSALS